MKKLLYTLFIFVSCNIATYETVYAQTTISHKVTAGPATSNATSYSIAATTFTAGRMYILLVTVTGATTAGTITASSQTWNMSGSTGDATQRIQVFTTIPSSTVNEVVTFGNFGSTGTGFSMSVFEVTGMATSGTVRQVVYGAATGADPSLTLATLDPNSAVFTAFTNLTNPFNGTPEAGWTEQRDGGYDTPTSGVYVMYRGTTTDNTPTVTAASSTWTGLAIEIGAYRIGRIINAN